MSDVDIPKGLPKPIKFEDIKVGDKIRSVGHGRTIEGVVGRITAEDLWTDEGGFLGNRDGHQLYLLERPRRPVEPRNLGAVVAANDGECFVKTATVRLYRWTSTVSGVPVDWAEIEAPVVVLHEGWSG